MEDKNTNKRLFKDISTPDLVRELTNIHQIKIELRSQGLGPHEEDPDTGYDLVSIEKYEAAILNELRDYRYTKPQKDV